MTNRRRSPVRNSYRTGFLRSRAWFARRDRWFTQEERTGRPIPCAVCDVVGDKRNLELHHLDYAGVSAVRDGWRAFERHDDLLPMHPSCHELVHRLIDRDTVLSQQRTRRDATCIAVERLHAGFASEKEQP